MPKVGPVIEWRVDAGIALPQRRRRIGDEVSMEKSIAPGAVLGPTVAAVLEARQTLKDTSRVASTRRSEIVAISAVLFSERGYRGTSIRDIAERADILSGSLYHHFRTKESILDEIVRAYWSDLFDEYERVLQTERVGAAQIREMISVSLRMLNYHGPAIRILLNDYPYIAEVLPHIQSIMSVTERVWTDLLLAGAQDGGLRSDLDPVLTYRTIVGAISGTARWFDMSGTITLDEVITEMQQTFMLGISVPGSYDAVERT